MTAPDAGLVILVDEDVKARPGKDPRKALPDGLYPLTRFTAYLDRVVQVGLLFVGKDDGPSSP